MKTIGLLGGMSWESTLIYYRIINEAVRQRRGGLRSAPILLNSVDFEEIAALQRKQDWSAAGHRLGEAAAQLERGGADCIVICTNTMHNVADAIAQHTQLPLLHIVDATADAIRHAGIEKVGLLGTRFTMEQPFYAQRMEQTFGIEVLAPEDNDRSVMHDAIFEELCRGVICPQTKARVCQIIERLALRGARAVVLGCTEITMLLNQNDVALPVFDSTQIHAMAAVDWAMAA